jgi:ABC-2 type transport system ATP-binding protein
MIKTEFLVRNYGKRTVVNNLSLHIKAGEVFGLLGPNGAGKTTIVRMLNTLLLPSGGTARVGGFDVVKHCVDVRKLIGIVPQELSLDRDITGRQNLRIQGLLRKVKDIDEAIEHALSWSGIADRADDIVKKYSGGMQRRLLIARAVMHKPRVLFLDEPTVGLDPQIRRTIWDLIRQLKAGGMTILLTTHYIEEAEKLCERVGILSQGKLIACDTPQALMAGCGHFAVEVTTKGKTDFRMFQTRGEANTYAESVDGYVCIRQSSLEDVFIHLTGKKIGAQ